MTAPAQVPQDGRLNRVLTLPMLVFYGLGVTIGAGIFALVGAVLSIAGDRAPLAFLIAGLLAGATGVSYALLVRVFPHAGGEAVFVNRGLGRLPGALAGLGVAVTGIVSSAVIALAFAGYARSFIALPDIWLAPGLVLALGLVAWWGVRESVWLAAAITVLEVGTLLVVALHGLPRLAASPVPLTDMFVPAGAAEAAAIGNAGILAFFAFIGFEDIENMAEETRDPARDAPRAIFITLAVTVAIYLAIAMIAAAMPQRSAITGSAAPLAELFRLVSGNDPAPVAAIAAIAMINGVLVQIVMASRVLYGMAHERLIPLVFGTVDTRRRTPLTATIFVTAAIGLLAALFPLVGLAEVTSLVTLAVFALVNLSLFTLGRSHGDAALRRWRWWGLGAALLCAAMAAFEIARA
jgi:amino acid transporter